MPELNKTQFHPEFTWGVSTAAYQIEGAHNKNGKGMSIWDTFTHKRAKNTMTDTGDTACNFYDKYKTDIDMLAEMGFTAFRFSLSWSRIIPEGTGNVNKDGIDFYNRVIDYCLLKDIEPWVTAYHWDLPQKLEDQGGWTNRNIVGWFAEYCGIIALNFGDRVKKWMVLNEPMVFTGAGYFLGVHAPGKRGMSNFIPAIHHAVLAQAEGGRILKKNIENSKIGTTFSCSSIVANSKSLRDKKAALRVDTLLNRLFIEPALGLGYPIEDLPSLKRLRNYMHPEDIINMRFDFDFIGIQNYTREMVKYSWFTPYIQAKIVPAFKRGVKTSAMGWEIYPDSLNEMLAKFSKYPIKDLYVTENGIAFSGENEEDVLADSNRIDYFKKVLKGLKEYSENNNNLKGYFIWTFIDNFEWAEGFFPRFGIVYMNLKSLERKIKLSGFWWKKFLNK